MDKSGEEQNNLKVAVPESEEKVEMFVFVFVKHENKSRAVAKAGCFPTFNSL